MKKWWDNPTAAVGALMGEKAQAVAEYQITKKLQAEYERGLQEGKEGAVVHGHWEEESRRMFIDLGNAREQYAALGYPHRTYINLRCLACRKATMVDETIAYKYCPHCGAKMDEEGAE